MSDARRTNPVAELETMARAGYAARGIVYLLLGYFAWTTGGGEATTNVMERLGELPLGAPMLILVALGMLGYGVFRIYGAAVDIKGKGNDAKGLFGRAGPTLSGLAHIGLAVVAVRIAIGLGEVGEGDGGRQMAETAMTFPGGTLLVALAGAIGLAAGIGNLYKAWTCAFMEDLSADTPRLARWAGRAGYTARGVVFGLIGWQILALAIGWQHDQIGMESAMTELRRRDWLFPLIAAGLAAFGIFSLIMARWAQIRNEDVGRRLKRAFGG